VNDAIEPYDRPVIGDNLFTRMDVMIHLIRNFLAYLGKLFLFNAMVSGKIRWLIFAKGKGFAITMSAPSRVCSIGQEEIK
jgi:hypothetical protein